MRKKEKRSGEYSKSVKKFIKDLNCAMRMSDGLVALLTALTETKPNCQRIAERAPDMHQFLGRGMKNHLRDALNKFVSGAEQWARHLMVEDIEKLPSYCTEIEYTGTNFVAYGRSGEITTFDGAVEINGRPVIVDTRDTWWAYVKSKYFREQDTARVTLLDDLFGAGNYDRVLALPSDCAPQAARTGPLARAPNNTYRGVHIARMPFTKAAFDKYMAALAGEFDLFASASK